MTKRVSRKFAPVPVQTDVTETRVVVSDSTFLSRDIPTSRLGLILAGEANVSVSRGRSFGLVSAIYVSCPRRVVHTTQARSKLV